MVVAEKIRCGDRSARMDPVRAAAAIALVPISRSASGRLSLNYKGSESIEFQSFSENI
jgi:hypothetical protein